MTTADGTMGWVSVFMPQESSGHVDYSGQNPVPGGEQPPCRKTSADPAPASLPVPQGQRGPGAHQQAQPEAGGPGPADLVSLLPGGRGGSGAHSVGTAV